MKFIKLGSILYLIGIFVLQAKGQTVVFENAVQSSGTEMGNAVIEASDSSLIIVGSTDINTSGLADIKVTKFTPGGTEIWSVVHGGFNNDFPHSAHLLEDGNFVIVGTTGSFTSTPSRDVYLLKMDTAGNILWTKSFGGAERDEGTDVKETPEGDLIITAFTESYGAGDRDAWLLKTDSAGNLLWEQTFGGAEFDDAWAVDISPDGGYILTGGTYSQASGTEDDLWLIKTDTAGNELWTKTFGVANRVDWGWDVAATQNGYVAVGLHNNDPGQPSPVTGNAHFIKVDLQGNLVWDKSVSGSFRNEGFSVSHVQGGGWLISGTKVTAPANSSFWVAKANAQGDILWEVDLGQANSINTALDVIQTWNGDVVATGFSGYTPNSNQDLHVLRLADHSMIISEGGEMRQITAVPNPTTGPVKIQLDRHERNGNIKVFNETGKLVKSHKFDHPNQVELDLSDFPAGLYMIHIITSKERAQVKIVKY